MAFFSIIIPVYNVEKYIKECIESIVNQTYKDFEAIFVDDCGTDKSMKIVEEYAKRDNRIKIIRNGINKGVSASRNAALNYASGDYVLCVDSDDWIELNTLEILNNEIQIDPDVNSIFLDAREYYQNINKFEEKTMFNCSKGYLYIIPENIIKLPGDTFGKLYKTSVLKNAGIYYPENITMGEDTEFNYKFFSICPFGTKVIEDCLYNYRINNESICSISKSEGDLDPEKCIPVITNTRNFYIEKNLYNKYKITLLQYIHRMTGDCRVWSKKRYNEFTYLLKELYDITDFPNDFKEFDYPVNPKISIIFPIRNNSCDIDKIIKNIQTQKYKNIELVCLHNNEESIRNRLDLYCRKDKRIKSINYNALEEENIELKTASGFYIMFINEFITLENNSLNEIINKFVEINVASILLKSELYSDNHNINSGFISVNDNIKTAISEGKILPVIRKRLLAQCNYSILELFEKYQDMFLF